MGTNELRKAFPGGNTYTADALYKTRTQVFHTDNGDRGFAPNVVIMMTDGDPTVNVSRTLPESELLRTMNSDTSVFVVGITNNVKNETLKELSSYPQVPTSNINQWILKYFYNLEIFRQ